MTDQRCAVWRAPVQRIAANWGAWELHTLRAGFLHQISPAA